MNRHALSVLQYPAVLDVVAGHASSGPGAAAIRALHPAHAAAWIDDELRRVEELALLLTRAADFVMPPIPEVHATLTRLGVAGSVLDPVPLRDLADLLHSSAHARTLLDRHRDDYPRVAALTERLLEQDSAEARIRSAVDEAGAVRDHASRELGRLRRESRSARGRIVERLAAYAASLPARYQVSDASVTVRDGRYVIPIRREARAEVGGLVHDESATGGTLFVEPPIALDLMNRLRQLELAEAREVLRILREITDTLRPLREPLHRALTALIELDSLFGRARYALAHRGHRPAVLDGAREYRVNFARHPLLLARSEPVVPFDLALDADERTLLVSGPNTGGKTVLLKAVGLFSALAQAGIIPPVGAGASLPLFRDIFADIGDEQSIEASLSTFSAHLRNLREILDQADAFSLVLIDEMGSGTDPAEGGALARAILLELTERGTLTIATTHLGELKGLAADAAGVVNASLQFDAVELQPTYRLLKGVPGRSYGLAIARRLGFPAAVLARAEDAVPLVERQAARLLAELEAKDRTLADALARVAAEEARTASLAQDLDEREHVLRQREREAEGRARQQARDLLLAAREDVDDAIRELRESVAAEADALDAAAHAARRRVEESARVQRRGMPRELAAASSGTDLDQLEIGMQVRVQASGLEGRISEVRDGRATVAAGALRLQVPLTELTRVGSAADAAAPRTGGPQRSGAFPGRTSGASSPSQTAPAGQPRRGAWAGPELDAAPEVDLRGLRAEEAIAQLVPALDAAVSADLPSLRIIHGKGTGALREVVTEVVRNDPRVRSFRAGGQGEGGTGVTVAELK